jgi:hypothetical protein
LQFSLALFFAKIKTTFFQALGHQELHSGRLIFNQLFIPSLVDVGLDPNTIFNLVLAMKLITNSHLLHDILPSLSKVELNVVFLEDLLLVKLPIVNAIFKAPFAVNGEIFAELDGFLFSHFELDVWEKFGAEFLQEKSVSPLVLACLQPNCSGFLKND